MKGVDHGVMFFAGGIIWRQVNAEADFLLYQIALKTKVLRVGR